MLWNKSQKVKKLKSYITINLISVRYQRTTSISIVDLRMSRTCTIRKMEKETTESLSVRMFFPYTYIGKGTHAAPGCFALKNITTQLVADEDADAGNFPQNIQEHFWIRLGDFQGRPWISTGVLTNGNYFYYVGNSGSVGFEMGGSMCLRVAKSWATIVEAAMTESEYQIYMASTVGDGHAAWMLNRCKAIVDGAARAGAEPPPAWLLESCVAWLNSHQQ